MLTTTGVRATIVDLTTSTSGDINGGIFTTDFTQPAGSGVIDPFLTIQNTGLEQGYNGTDSNFDTKRVPQYTHEIQLGDLNVQTVNGQQYYSFLIDTNQQNNNPNSLISLDMVKIFTSSSLQSNTSTDTNGLFNGSLGTLRYSFSSGSYVKYNDANSGSGQADIAFLVPVSDFAGSKSTDYVYMYQQFGTEYSANGGYEETTIGSGEKLTPIPEVSALLPLGGVLLVAGGMQYARRRRDVTA